MKVSEEVFMAFGFVSYEDNYFTDAEFWHNEDGLSLSRDTTYKEFYNAIRLDAKEDAKLDIMDILSSLLFDNKGD